MDLIATSFWIVLAVGIILYVLDECVNKLKRTRGLKHLLARGVSWRERTSTMLRGFGWLFLGAGAAGSFTMLLPGDTMPAGWFMLGYALSIIGLAMVLLHWRIEEPEELPACDPDRTQPMRDPFQQTQVLRR